MFLLTESLWDPTARQAQRRAGQDGGCDGWISALAKPSLLCDFLDLCSCSAMGPQPLLLSLPSGLRGTQGVLMPCSPLPRGWAVKRHLPKRSGGPSTWEAWHPQLLPCSGDSGRGFGGKRSCGC